MTTSAFLGKWENTSNENFEEFMKAIGIGDKDKAPTSAPRPQSSLKSTVEFSESGGKITQKMIGSQGTLEFTYELGKEFQQPLPHDKNLQSKNLVTLDGNKLIHKVSIGDKDIVTTNEIIGNELVARHAAGPLVGIRRFKKVA